MPVPSYLPLVDAARWVAGVNPGIEVAVPPDPDERRAFDAHRIAVSSRMWPRLGVLLSLCAVVWWPLDFVFFEDTRTRGYYALFRTGIVVLSLVPAASAAWFVSLGTRWGLVALTTVMLAQVTWATTCISLLSEGDAAWFGFFYPIPAFTILLLVPIGQRVVVTLLMAAAAWLSFHLSAPKMPELAAVAASEILFTALLAVALGHLLYEALLGQFVLGRRLDAERAATARLNAELEDRVAAQTADLLDLSKRAERAREEERRRIARNLHDELGQELTAMALLVSQLEAAAPGDEAIPLRSALDRARETLSGVLDDLEPRALDALGLEGALRELVRERCELAGLAWEVRVERLLAPVADAHAVALFRVAQEGLNNVLRHASCAHVRVGLAEEGASLVLTLADDGRGIHPGAQEGRGMSIIRARCDALGGTAAWLPGPGATLRVRLPRRAA